MNKAYNNNVNRQARREAIQQSIAFDYNDDDAAAPSQPTSKPPASEAATGEKLGLPSGQMRFMSFGSGSSGNCSYLGNGKEGVLIDAGVDVDHVFDSLHANGIEPSQVKGIVLTHDHMDHVRYVYKIVRKYKHIAVYCTPKLLTGLLRRHSISRRLKDYHHPIFKEIEFQLAGMTFTAFATSHDGTDNMGFYINSGGQAFVVATDMGIITDRAAHYMRQANYLMIESDYDRQMLDNGSYPEILKHRIRGPEGHLSNIIAAQFVKNNYSKQLKYLFLCHLSKDNNTPELARAAMTSELGQIGVSVGDASNAIDQRDRDVQLYALPRYDASPLFLL